MLRMVGIRVLSVIPVLLGISVITFFLVRMIPGDVVSTIMGQDFGNPELEAELRSYFGLDLPVHEQFMSWFTGLLQGDLGTSMRSGRPVLDEILLRFPLTFELAVAALIVSLAISIPMGIVSATRRNGPLDTGFRIVSLVGLSLPNFWLGIMLIMLFSVRLGWLPSGGATAFAFNWDHFRYLLLPAVALGTSLAAVTMRMTRSALLEVLDEDYVRTAHAKGLAAGVVTRRHALRNAMIPVVTVIGIQAGALLGGTVVVEQVFSWPGLGELTVRAISQRDYPLVQGTILFLAFFYVVVNLIVDIIYMYLDPRLRHRG